MKILTAQQLHELDRITVQTQNMTSLDLMERASQAIVKELTTRWNASRRFVVFAGPGGNGGDALATARMLVERGYSADVFLLNIKGQLHPDCATNCERLKAIESTRLRFVEIQGSFDFPQIDEGDIVLDGLFGTGLSRPLDGGFAALVNAINANARTIVSIDTPSGLMSEDNTYNDMRAVIRASLTLTMHRMKLAHLFAENEPYVGKVQTLDIGLDSTAEAEMNSTYSLTTADDIRKLLRERPLHSHKGTMGHAILLAGSRGMAGAAILAAKGCLRGGAGKVTVATTAANILPLQVAVPEAIVYTIGNGPVASTFAQNSQAVGIGPGMGLGEMNTAMLHLLRTAPAPMVIDADALTLLGSHREWLDRIPSGSILTPHPAELDRIVGRCTDTPARLRKAIELARNCHAHILLKGHYSAVIAPNGDVCFNTSGNAGMATAGSGDVLTGILTALLAQGYPAAHALKLGAWIHGRAGDLALAETGSPEAVTASDIIAHIGHAFGELRE